MEEVGNLYSEAKGQSWQLQELRGTFLSRIISKQGNIAVSKAEIIAKGSEEYEKYIIGTAEAMKKELKLKSQYESLKARFEAYRSLISKEKKTMGLIGDN